MMNEREKFNKDEHELPADVALLASDLDALGSVERAGAPVDLEDCLLNAALNPSTTMRLVHDSHDRAVPARRQRRFMRKWQFQLAAGVTLLVAAGGAWIGLRGGGTPDVDPDETALVALESEIEEWLSVASVFEADVEQEIDLLFAETESFNAGLSGSWTVEDIFDEGSAL